MLKNYVRPTLLVRNVMKSFGKPSELVFTNSYKACRTVKCYGVDPAMQDQIASVLVAAGVKDFKIKNTAGRMFRRGSTIVRIPRSEQV